MAGTHPVRYKKAGQHFQHLLGYRARNLHVGVTEPGALLAEPASGRLRTRQA